MSTRLNIKHFPGLTLRTQTLQPVPKRDPANGKPVTDESGAPVMADVKKWAFEEPPVQQTSDPRTHEPSGEYSLFVGYNLRRLVLDSSKGGENVAFLNENVRQQLRVQQQVKKDGKWTNMGQPTYVAPRATGGAYVGDSHRAIVEELPS
jgi:hypothetical protein